MPSFAQVRLRTKVVLMALLTMVGLVAIPASSASAAPARPMTSGCGGFYSWLFGLAQIQCSSGSYAVTTYCKNWLGYTYYAQGPRVWAPEPSTVYCNGGYRPSNVGYVSYS